MDDMKRDENWTTSLNGCQDHGAPVSEDEIPAILTLLPPGCTGTIVTWTHNRLGFPQALIMPVVEHENPFTQGSLFMNGKLYAYSLSEH